METKLEQCMDDLLLVRGVTGCILADDQGLCLCEIMAAFSRGMGSLDCTHIRIKSRGGGAREDFIQERLHFYESIAYSLYKVEKKGACGKVARFEPRFNHLQQH